MQKFMFARIEVWVLLAVVLFGFLSLIVFGGVVLDTTQGRARFGAIGTTAVALARLPLDAENILKASNPMQVPQKHRFEDQFGWSWAEGATGTGLPGYYIMSYHIAAEQRPRIDMVRLSDGKVVHSWKPDIDILLAKAKRTSKLADIFNYTNGKYDPYHPTLMPNGDLITKATMTPLLRIDSCAKGVWMNDDLTFHHSTEPDGEGNFWSPTLAEPATLEDVPPTFREDTLTQVTAEGKVLQQISLPEILLRHGMEYLLFPPGQYSDDPLHLNDIQPALADGPFWKKGDLFLSMRGKSLLMQYRPSTDEIVWMQQGPWRGEHDVDILDDHRIAVFDNAASNRSNGLGKVDRHSDIIVYDFATKSFSRPYSEAMEREDVIALYEGLYTILPSGAVIVEDHNSGRILFLGADGHKLGQFINRNPDGIVYQIGWGRYIDQAYGDAALQQMAALPCDPS